MKLAPSDIIVGDRVRKDVDTGIAELKNSILAVGQLQPIGIDEDYNLLFGRRRLRACELLDIDVICVQIVNLDDAVRRLQAERDENTCRRDFTPSEAVELGKRLEALEAPKAAERKAAGTNQHSEPASESDEASKGRTDEKVAAAVGMGKDKYRAAKLVVENGTPELVAAVDDGSVSINAAAKIVKAEQAEEDSFEPPKRITRRLHEAHVFEFESEMRKLVESFSRRVRKTHGNAIKSMPVIFGVMDDLKSQFDAVYCDIDCRRAKPEPTVEDYCGQIRKTIEICKFCRDTPEDAAELKAFLLQLAAEVPVKQEAPK